jgi:hypothetical protein
MLQKTRQKNICEWLCIGLVIFLSGCMQKPSKQQTVNLEPLPVSSESQTQEQKVADKQDPLEDAEQAISELDFRLLAFTNKVIHFPGIDEQTYTVSWIEKHCGIRYLKGAGDILKIGIDGSARSELKRYASIYNSRILKACLVFQKNYTES